MTPPTTSGLRPNRAINRFGRYLALGIALLLLGKCAWVGFNSFPTVNIYGGAVSPSGQWVALLEYAQDGLLMTGHLDTAVELRRFNEPLELLTGRRVFVVTYVQDNALLGVRWIDEHSIVVTTRPFDQKRLGLQMNEYKGIKIAYDVPDDR